MNVRVRASRIHNDSGREEQRRRELPGLIKERNENWMAGRPKNALGTAKLASHYSDQARGRVAGVRKTKSVLVPGKLIGKKDTNRRRHRPYPSKSSRPLKQRHRVSWETCGQLLPDGSLPSLTSGNPSHPIGNPSLSGPPMFPVERMSSYDYSIAEDTHKNGYALSGGADPTSDKPPHVTGRRTSTTSAVRPLPFPGGESSDSCGVGDCEENPRYDETRARKAETMNRVLPAREPSSFADGGFSAASLGSQYHTSPKRWEGVVNMDESTRRGVNETAKPGVSSLRQSNPALVETQVPITSERGSHGWNTSEASSSLHLSTTPKATNDGGDAEGPSLEQSLVNPLARIQANEDLDALRSGNIEALSIPQSTSCSSSVASRTTNSGDNQKKDDIAVQAARIWKNLRERSDFATVNPDGKNVGNTSNAPLAPGVEGVPAYDGEEALSVNLPRIGSREQDALRLLYRKWWMQLARGGSVSCLPRPLVGRDKQTEWTNEDGGKKENTNLGPHALARVELRKSLNLDSSTARDDVAVATEIELPGSLSEVATTLFTSLGVRQPLGEEMTNERPIIDAAGTWNKSKAGRRPQLKDKYTDGTISMMPASSSTSTFKASDDAGKTSNCRTRTINISSVVSFVRDEQITSLRQTESRAASLNTAEGLVRNDPLGYTDNQPDQSTTDCVRWKGGEHTFPLRIEDVPTVPRQKDVDVETEAESPESFGDVTGTSPASSEAQRTSMGVEMDERRRSGTEVATSMTLASPPIITRGTNHEAPILDRTRAKGVSLGSAMDLTRDMLTSHGCRTRARAISLDSAADLARNETSEYAGYQPNQASSDSRRWDGEEQVLPQDALPVPTQKYAAVKAEAKSTGRLSDDAKTPSASPGVQLTSGRVETDEKRPSCAGVATSVTVVSPPIITRGATHEAHHTVRDRTRTRGFSLDLGTGLARDERTSHDCTRARATSLDSAMSFVQNEPSRYTDNQPNGHTTGARQERREEQAIPLCIQNDPAAPTQKDVAFEMETKPLGSLDNATGSSFVSHAGQVTPVGLGKDERRRSHTGVATFTTLVSPLTINRGATHDTHHTVRGQTTARGISLSPATNLVQDEHARHGRCTRVRALSLDSAASLARNQTSGYSGNQSNQTLNHARLEREEEQVVPRYSRDATTLPTRKDISVETEAESLGTLGDHAKTPPDFSGVQLTSVGVVTDEIRSCVRAITGSLNSGRRAHWAAEGTKLSTSVTPMSPPFHPRSATGLARDELSESTGNHLNQTLSNARQGIEDQQAGPRHSRYVSTIPIRKDRAVATEIQLPWNLSLTSSVFHGVTSGVAGTDERRSIGAKATGNSDAVQFPQGRSVEIRAAASVSPLKPPYSTYGAVDAAGRISESQTRVRTFHPGSEVGLTREGLPEYTGSEPNQISSHARQGEEEKQARSRYSQDAREVPKRKDDAVATEIQLPWNLFDVSTIPSASRGVNPDSFEAPDQRRSSGASATKSPDAAKRPQGGGGDTEAMTSANLSDPPAGTYGVTDDARYTSRGQRKVSAFLPNSAADRARNEYSGSTGNQLHQALSNARRGTEDKQEEPRYSRDATKIPTQKNGAVATEIQLPWNLSLIPSVFRGVQLTSAMETTNERRSIGSKATGNVDAVQFHQGGDVETKVATSVTPLAPLTSIFGAIDEAGNNNQSRTRVRAFHPDSIVGLVQEELPDYTGNRSNQVSNEVRRGKEEEQAGPRHSQSATRAPTQKDSAITTELQFPSNLFDVSTIPPASLGGTPSSVKAAVEKRRSGVIATGSSSADRFSQGGCRDTEDTTSATPWVPRTGTYGTTENADHTGRGRTRESAFRLCSTMASARDEPSASAGSEPNQALSNAKGGTEKRQAGQRYSQDVTTSLRQKDGAIATEIQLPWRLLDVSSIPSVSRGVQLNSVRVGTGNRCSSDARAFASPEVGRRSQPQEVGRDTDVATPMTPLSQPTVTCGNKDDASYTSYGRTRICSFPSVSGAGLARDEPLEYTGNQLNQGLSDARRRTEEEQAGPRYAQDATTTPSRKDDAVATEIQFPRNVFGFSSIPSASRKVQLTSERVGTDERLSSGVSATRSSDAIRCPYIAGGSVAATISTASSSLLSGTCGNTEGVGHTSHGEMRARASSSEWAVGLARDESPRYTGNQPASAGAGPDEIQRNGSRSKGGSDAIQRPQGGDGDTEAATSVVHISLPITARGATDEARHIMRGQSRVSSSLSGSQVVLTRDEPSGCKDNQPDQTSRDARRGTEDEQAGPRCSQDATEVPTREDCAVTRESQLPRSLSDVLAILSGLRGVRLVSVGEGTDERRSSDERAIGTSDANRRPQDAGKIAEAATSAAHLSSRSGTYVTAGDAGYISRGQTRIRAFHPVPEVGLVRDEHPENTGIQVNQISRDARREREEEQAGSQYSQDATTALSQEDLTVAVETQLSRWLSNGSATPLGSLGIKLASAGAEMVETSDGGTRTTGSSGDVQRPQGVGRSTEAATSMNQVLPSTRKCGVTDYHDYIRRERTRVSLFSPGSAVDLARDKPSNYTDIEPNQTSNNTRRECEVKSAGLRPSQDATTVTTQQDGAAATANQLPREYFDVSVFLPPVRRVQLTSAGARTDERRRSVAGATRSSSNTGRCSQSADGDSKVARFVTPISPPTCTCSATDNGGHNNHGLTRTSAFPPGSVASLAPDEPLENTGNQLSHTSGDARRGEEGGCKVSHCSQHIFPAPARKHAAAGPEIQLPWRINDIMGSLSLSPGVKRTSGADERRRSGARAIRSSLDAEWNPQSANGGTGAVSSVTPMLPPTSTCGVSDDAGDKSRGRTRVSFLSHRSEADLARKDLSEYKGNQPNQASCNARRSEEEEQAVSGCSQDFTTARTRKKVDIATKPGSPGNLRDITGSSSASPGAQLTSVGVGTEEIHRSDAKATRSSSGAGRRPQGASEGPEYATSVTSLTSPICTCVATDAGYTNRGQTSVNSARRGSDAYLAQNGPSGYTGNSSNQASSGARRGEPEKQTVPICSQDYVTVRTRKDVAVSARVESPGSLRDVKGDLSAVPEVRLTSEGVETDGRRGNSTRATRSCLDVSRSPQGAKNDTDATTSVSSMSPPTCTCDATSRDRARVNILSHCSEADLGRKESSVCTGNPFNQASSDDRQGREEEHDVTRYSQDITTACTRNDIAVATKVTSPGSPGDITAGPCASSGVHPALAGIGTEKRCRRGARATRSFSEVGHSTQVASGDNEAARYSDLISPPKCTCGAVDDASHTSRGRTKVNIVRLSSEEDLAQEEPLGYAGNSCYQTLRDARRGRVENYEGIRSSQDSTTFRTLKHVAVAESPRSLGDITGSPYPSPGLQRVSVEVGTDGSCRNSSRATKSSSDVGQLSQGSSKDTETAMSTISVSPSICACGATKAGQTNRGRTRDHSLSRNSDTDLAREECSGNTINSSYQASSDARRRKERKREVTQYSHAGTSKARSPESLGDITRSSFNSPGLQLNLVGGGTDERRRSGGKTKKSSSEVDRRTQGGNEKSAAATSVTPMSSLKCACRTTDAGNTSRGRTRVNSISRSSETDSAWGEHSGNTGILSYHTPREVGLGKEEEQAVPRCCRDAATARARKNSHVSTNAESPRSLYDATGSPSASPGVSLVSVGVGTDVRRRGGAKAKRSRLDVNRRRQGASEDTEAVISVTQVSPPTCACRATGDAVHNSRGRTRLNSSSHGLGADYARKEPSGYKGNPSNQISRDVSPCKEDEHEASRSFQDSITAHTRKNISVVTKIESPGSLGDVTWSLIASPGVQLTSGGVGTDERFRSRTRVTRSGLKAERRLQGVIKNADAAKSVTSSPPTCTCGATDNAGLTSRDQTEENSLSRGSKADLAWKDPWGYTGDQITQVASDDRRGKEENQAIRQCSKNLTTAHMRKTVDVAAKTEPLESLGSTTGSPSAYPGVHPSVGEGTDKRRRSGGEAIKSSDVGRGARRDSEVATSVASIPPSTCACGAADDAGHNSRGRTRIIPLNRVSEAYFPLRERSRKMGNKFYQASSDDRRGNEEERGVQRRSQDLTKARTRK